MTLIRAVLLIGLVDGEVKDDFVMLEVSLENVLSKSESVREV